MGVAGTCASARQTVADASVVPAAFERCAGDGGARGGIEGGKRHEKTDELD